MLILGKDKRKIHRCPGASKLAKKRHFQMSNNSEKKLPFFFLTKKITLLDVHFVCTHAKLYGKRTFSIPVKKTNSVLQKLHFTTTIFVYFLRAPHMYFLHDTLQTCQRQQHINCQKTRLFESFKHFF